MVSDDVDDGRTLVLVRMGVTFEECTTLPRTAGAECM